MKHLKFSSYELYALIMIVVAIVVRVILTSYSWPQTNSDEDTIGLMAMHIASRGEHPTFFYGQNYMGSLEAFLVAGLFQLFGTSLFTLRLALMLLFALFLLCVYLLTSLLYTKKLALVSLILLSLGSWVMLYTQLIALGGYPETLLFGTLALLIATVLALSYGQYASPSRRWLRLLGYGCWGLVVGLALWTDFLVLPFVLMSGLLLAVFCWRELLSLAPVCLLLGLIMGAFPLIVYNFNAPPGYDSWTVLQFLHKGGGVELTQMRISGLEILRRELQGTLLVTLPSATGSPPLCLDPELRLFGHAIRHPLRCTFFHAGWSLVFLVLWASAVFGEIRALWMLRRQVSFAALPNTERQTIVRHFARLMLLASACMALLLFMLSPIAAIWPTDARYLIGLLIATPSLISPLWDGASSFLPRPLTLETFQVVVRRAVLVLLGIILLVGTISTFFEIPATQAANQEQYALISDLSRIKVSHIYSDYWTCNRIIFQSNERIICGVLNDLLQPSYNRYNRYYTIVSADLRSAYVFHLKSPQAIAFLKRLARSKKYYRNYVFVGYLVYEPG